MKKISIMKLTHIVTFGMLVMMLGACKSTSLRRSGPLDDFPTDNFFDRMHDGLLDARRDQVRDSASVDLGTLQLKKKSLKFELRKNEGIVASSSQGEKLFVVNYKSDSHQQVIGMCSNPVCRDDQRSNGDIQLVISNGGASYFSSTSGKRTYLSAEAAQKISIVVDNIKAVAL